MTDPDQNSRLSAIREEVKELLVSSLSLEDINPSEIKDDEPLFGEGMGLDTLDAVEIVVQLQRNYGLEIKDMDRGKKVYQSINTLSRFICENTENS